VLVETRVFTTNDEEVGKQKSIMYRQEATAKECRRPKKHGLPLFVVSLHITGAKVNP